MQLLHGFDQGDQRNTDEDHVWTILVEHFEDGFVDVLDDDGDARLDP